MYILPEIELRDYRLSDLDRPLELKNKSVLPIIENFDIVFIYFMCLILLMFLIFKNKIFTFLCLKDSIQA